MILSDTDLLRLRKRRSDPLVVRGPIDHRTFQPCSIDLTVSNELMFLGGPPGIWLTTGTLPSMTKKKFVRYLLKPGEFVLASTQQYFEIPRDHVAQVDGKSSLGRIGMFVHITAGWIDPGFRGNITLEMCNINKYPIEIFADMPIAQLIVMQLTGKAKRRYGHTDLGSKYQDSHGVHAMKPKPSNG